MLSVLLNRPPARSAFIFASTFALAGLLGGCSGFQTSAMPGAIAGVKLSGSVHGGQQPVTGSHIYLYATSTSGYGAASTSLLTSGLPGVTTDGSGSSFVTTDASGRFTITGDYTCPSFNRLVYIVAQLGNPGLAPGSNNTAINLVAALGTCGSLTPLTQIVINEVSTAAAVTTLQQFTADFANIGAPSTNTQGITNAFNIIPNLVDISTGQARTTTVNGNGTVPVAKINTLANIIAPCINSASSSSPACTSLFTAATPTGGNAPSDTFKAMLAIATNPGHNVSMLYNQINPAAPFQPTLASAPNDLSLSLTYTGGGLTAPGQLVIDANGNALVGNCPTCFGGSGTDSIVGFSPLGVPFTGTSGYTSGIHKPQGLAIDQSGNIWSANDSAGSSLPDSVVKMNSSGTATATYTSPTNLSRPVGVAIDPSNNAWVTNQTGNTTNMPGLIELNAFAGLANSFASNFLLGATGVGIDPNFTVFTAASASNDIYRLSLNPVNGQPFNSAGISGPIDIAIDHNDYIWTLNNTANTLSVINGGNGNAVTTSVGVGTSQAAVIAIDGVGTGWVANCRASCPGSGSGPNYPDNLLHFNVNGMNLTGGSDGFQDSKLSAAGSAAIDGSGNVWVTNNAGASLTQFLGLAAPVKTPLATAVGLAQLGVKP